MVSPASTWGLEGKQLLQFGKAIEDFAEKQYPIINGFSLNRAAAETREEYANIVKRRFTLRTKGTIQSIQFRKVKGFNPKTQESSVGSTVDYMAAQEFGDISSSKGKYGKSIPSSFASDESQGAKPRAKKVQPAKRMSRIRLTKSKVRGFNRKHHSMLVIRAAAEKGSGNFVFLPLQGAKGIYRVTGKGKHAKIKMVYSLSKKIMEIKKKPSLTPAVNNIIPKMPRFYIEAAEKRLNKAFKF